LFRQNDTFAGWSLAGPALTGLLLFLLVPFVLAVALSFTNYRFNSPLPTRWIGWDNYRWMFADAGFQRALLNTFLFVGVVVPLQTTLALGLAVLVNRPLKRMLFFRTVFFMPVIYPLALVSVVWALLLAPGPQGMMNQVLHAISFGAWNPAADVLRHPVFALPAIVLMSLWQGVGYQMVILLAGLQAIPPELYEAATMDRASRWQQFWHVTVPQLRHTLLFVVVVTTILAFRLFDPVWMLTQGGPQDATTTVMFESFVTARERNQVGRGAAMSVVFCAIVGVVALTQQVLARQER
jgi:multiple sugar transport system permease protein